MNNIKDLHTVSLPQPERQALLSHCLRKLGEHYLPNESPERKAYGLIGGRIIDGVAHIELVGPLCDNGRHEEAYQQSMNQSLQDYAIESETPMKQRGWVASGKETMAFLTLCQQRGLELIGNYHMHRVAWDHDPDRQRPTELDCQLATNSDALVFIISTINSADPSIRVFYEGIIDQELPIIDPLNKNSQHERSETCMQ